MVVWWRCSLGCPGSPRAGNHQGVLSAWGDLCSCPSSQGTHQQSKTLQESHLPIRAHFLLCGAVYLVHPWRQRLGTGSGLDDPSASVGPSRRACARGCRGMVSDVSPLTGATQPMKNLEPVMGEPMPVWAESGVHSASAHVVPAVE